MAKKELHAEGLSKVWAGRSRAAMSKAEETIIEIYRANEFLRHKAGLMFEEHGITSQQYNVLRILRGAGPEGLPTLELGNRMVQNTPGITRLLDRIEAKGLAERRRSSADRRLQLCVITKAGLQLLDELDPLAREFSDRAMQSFTQEEMKNLRGLLQRLQTTH